MITNALPDIDSYIAFFSSHELPVLRKTARELSELRKEENKVSGRRIATTVLQDPLLALRLLVYLQSHRSERQNHDITTIERAIMMLGITPFFEIFSELPTIEDRLEAHPRALIRLLKVIGRAKTAAQYARDWAAVRHDIDLDEVTVAALLHDAAEILFWCFAPVPMQSVAQLMQHNPGLRSASAQQQVLGANIHDVQLALAKTWQLPTLLVTLMDEAEARNARVRNVLLANNLARHSANGWADPALPDDYRAISELLHIKLENVVQRIGVPQEHWPPELKDDRFV